MDFKTEQHIYTEKRINPSLAEYEHVFGINVSREFSDRRILDLGSKNDSFARAVKAVYPALNTEIISLDHNVLEKSISDRSKRVRAKAQMLPFKDESFDLVLAHFSVPFWLPGRDKSLTDQEKLVQEMESVLDEVSRILGSGVKLYFPLGGWLSVGCQD